MTESETTDLSTAAAIDVLAILDMMGETFGRDLHDPAWFDRATTLLGPDRSAMLEERIRDAGHPYPVHQHPDEFIEELRLTIRRLAAVLRSSLLNAGVTLQDYA